MAARYVRPSVDCRRSWDAFMSGRGRLDHHLSHPLFVNPSSSAVIATGE